MKMISTDLKNQLSDAAFEFLVNNYDSKEITEPRNNFYKGLAFKLKEGDLKNMIEVSPRYEVRLSFVDGKKVDRKRNIFGQLDFENIQDALDFLMV